jgi:hypothetical protein
MNLWRWYKRLDLFNLQVRVEVKVKKTQPQVITSTYSISDILPQISKGRILLDGDWMRIGRFEVYRQKGVKCVECGLEAKFFRKERSSDPRSKYPCLNLYGFDAKNRLVLFTRDHILPRSRGGTKTLDNLQPMCAPCNNKKADKITLDICSFI